VTTRCVRELTEAGLLVRTRLGARPNRAAWFGVGWMGLHGSQADYDEVNLANYRKFVGAPVAPLAGKAGKSLIPPHGEATASIAPSHGVRTSPTSPSHGAMPPDFAPRLHRPTASI
jgi:hypothetical protein